MNNKNRFKGIMAVTTLSVLIQGCSTLSFWEDEQEKLIDTDYPYVEATESPKLKVPEGIKSPDYSNEYKVPQLSSDAETRLVGRDLDISSPRLVLPIVTGSRVLEGSREAVVQFDQVDDKVPLDKAIWDSLISYLDERGIGVVEFDKEQQKLKTDWMIVDMSEGQEWYSWTKTERSVGQRFEFTLDVKSHGRSATLNSKLVDYLETLESDVIADIPPSQVRRNEIEVLNDVIKHYEKLLVLADIKRLRQIAEGVPTELGFNSDGDSAYIVSANYDVTWPRLLLVLRKLGFNVKDLDKSTGLVFVNYAGVDEGWWNSLFSSEESLPLEQKAYRIFVKEQGEKTSITFKDEDNVALTPNVISQMYRAFAEVMTADDLDL